MPVTFFFFYITIKTIYLGLTKFTRHSLFNDQYFYMTKFSLINYCTYTHISTMSFKKRNKQTGRQVKHLAFNLVRGDSV